MKQSLAILLIAVFGLSQYAKQLSYMECKLANSFKSTEQRCDCEKENNIDKLIAKEIPSPKNHIHYSIDEFYTEIKEIRNSTATFAVVKPQAIYTTPGKCEGNCSRLYRPPRV